MSNSKIERLSLEEVRTRSRRIKLVLTDVDGVLTDTGVYYSGQGEELKRYCIRDGMGMERLRDIGIMSAMMTREDSPRVESRSKKLNLPYYFAGVMDKREALPDVMKRTGVKIDEIAYIGDDVNDIGIIEALADHGLTATPADGMLDVQQIVHYTCAAPGGNGAFRDFAEWIIKHRSQ